MAKRIPALPVPLNFLGGREKPPIIVRGGTPERVLLARRVRLWGSLSAFHFTRRTRAWGSLSAFLLTPHPVLREPSQRPVADPQEHHHLAYQNYLSPW